MKENVVLNYEWLSPYKVIVMLAKSAYVLDGFVSTAEEQVCDGSYSLEGNDHEEEMQVKPRPIVTWVGKEF